jgi:hypothetical protein
MAIERAIGFLRPHLITLRLLNALELAFIFVPALFAIPTLFSQFPIEFYPYRYLCSVGL